MGNQPGLHLTVKESIKGLESYVNLQGMGEIYGPTETFAGRE